MSRHRIMLCDLHNIAFGLGVKQMQAMNKMLIVTLRGRMTTEQTSGRLCKAYLK